MVQRYGIPCARDAAGVFWWRSAIDEVPRPFAGRLHCGGCSTAVEAVASFTRRVRNTESVVQAHYRLMRGYHHEIGCRYNVDHAMNQVLTEGRGQVDRTVHHWRLHLPAGEQGRPGTAQSTPAAATVRTRPRRPHSDQPRQLSTTISSAARIVRLIAACDQDPELVTKFRAVHNGHELTWREFCYGPRDYTALLARLTSGATSHPIAVHGAIHALTEGKSGTSYALHAQGRARGDDRWVPIVVRSTTRSLLPSDVSRHWLAVGHWQLWHAPHSHYRELRLWLDGTWNITSWSD